MRKEIENIRERTGLSQGAASSAQ